VEAVRFIQRELEEPRADVYALPQRHYILGKHDEAAYYWPEFQPRLFRRGAVILNATVHGGSVRAPEARLYAVPPETGVCMHHLSHKNVSQWIEKANRYTDNPDRLSAEDFSSDLVAYAHKRIDHFVSATQSEDRSSYPHAVAVLRALYDVIDRLKRWEAEHGVDGHSSFRDICARLNAEYDAAFPCRMVAHVATERHEADPAPVDAGGATPTADGRTVQMLLDALRHLRSSADAAQRRSEDLIQEQRAFFEAEKDRLRLLYEADVANHKASFEAETQRLRQAYEAHAASQTEDLNGYISRLWQLESERRALWQDRERHVHALQAAREHIQALESSTSWRLTKPLRRGIERVRGRGKRLRTLMVTLKSAVVAEEPTARAVLRNALLRRLRLLLPAQYASLLEKAALTESNTQALAPHQAATAS
jgi:cell division septum initiation protein DivIVA